MEEELKLFRQPDGKPYILKAIEIPQPQFDENGKRVEAYFHPQTLAPVPTKEN